MKKTPWMKLMVAAARYNIIRKTARSEDAKKALVKAAEDWWLHLTPATRALYEQRVEVACRHGEPCLWDGCPGRMSGRKEPVVDKEGGA